PTYASRAPCPTGASNAECVVFAETLSFHALLERGITPGGVRVEKQERISKAFAAAPGEVRVEMQRRVSKAYAAAGEADVRISTAALNSARFPIVSPPGNVRNQQSYIVDRIVDGGYLESYGVITALELAHAIRAIEPGLVPFVLALSNDPSDPIGLPDEID